MKKIIDYDVLGCTDSDKLAMMVRQSIKDGWQPFGNAFIGKEPCSDPSETLFMWQPIVKYED